MTSEGGILGTVFCLAPGVALINEIDERVDHWALRNMLYELAADTLPFAQGDPSAVIDQHLRTSVVPSPAKNAEVAPILDSLLGSSLGPLRRALRTDCGDGPS